MYKKGDILIRHISGTDFTTKKEYRIIKIKGGAIELRRLTDNKKSFISKQTVDSHITKNSGVFSIKKSAHFEEELFEI